MKQIRIRSFAKVTFAAATLGVLVAVTALSVRQAQGQGASAKMVVDEAAQALGGAERVKATKNITSEAMNRIMP